MHAPKRLPDCTGVAAEAPPGRVQYRVPHDDDGYYQPRSRVSVGLVVVHHHHHPPIVFVPTGGGSVKSSSGSPNGGKALAVALAVGALVAFPFIALGLAMGHPEPEEEVASAMDRVNEFNDQARDREAYCAAIAGAVEAPR